MEKRDDTTPQVRSRALMQESAAAFPPLTQVCGVEPLCRKRKRCRQRSNFRSPASQAMALPLELSGSAQPCLRGRRGPFGFNPLQLRPSYLRMPQSCRLRVCAARFNVMTIRGGPTSSANIILRTWRSFWATCHCYTDPVSGDAFAHAASATHRQGRVVFCRRWVFTVAPALATRTLVLGLKIVCLHSGIWLIHNDNNLIHVSCH